ncbi:retrovirus-related pol polyprotein from transposon TNT 1-94 [Tanacetum coccineum]
MQSDSPLPTLIATTSIITTTTSLPPPPQPQQSTVDPILVSRIGELEQHMEDLIQNNLALEERLDKQGTRLYNLDNLNIPHKEILQQRMFEDNSYKAHEAQNDLYEALQNSLELDYSNQRLADQEEARKKKRKMRAALRTPSGSPPSLPPPPPPLTCAFGTLDSLIQDDSIPDEQVDLSDDEDSENDHLPKADSTTASVLVSTFETPFENSLLAKTGDMTTFMKWYCQKVNKTILTQADFEGQAYEVVKAFYPDVIHLQFQIEECHKMLTYQVDWTNPEGAQVRVDVNRPLPLGGPPGHVTIQTQFFFNKDLEYLRYGSKGSSPALSISKMKAARYPVFGLELLVSEHMWIYDVCTYNISATYGISHWWFNRQKFYIDRHDSPSRRKEVRTHMRILSVIKVKAYSRYGDFEDVNLLLLQGHLNHLPSSDKRMLSTAIKLWTRNLVIRQRVKDFQLGIESYQTQLNLTKPGWDVTCYEFKHDYTIIESPRVEVFPVNNNKRKIIRFNEIYKFSDGTLIRILEALDYRVKEFKVKRLNLVKILRVLRIILEVLPEHPSDTKVVTMKMEILLEPTSNKLLWSFNSLVYSLHALSTLRRSGLRTASTAAKPYQGDSSEFYLIIESTAHVQPPVVQDPIPEPEVALKPNTKPSIPYPSRLNDQKLCEKANNKMLNLLTNKEKLFELANTPLNENCSEVLLKKLPEKLGDPGKFLIPCDFPELDKCLALADIGASINLMPLSVWKKISLPELTPTRMTLELANRSVAVPEGVAEDVFVKVGKFYFLADFVVVDYDVDPRVPLILGRHL